MKRLSLRSRMLALSLLATGIALAIAGWVMVGALGRFATEGIDRRLDAQLALLASTVMPDGRVDRERMERVRGALDAGHGWRWRIAGPRGTIGSTDFPEFDAPPEGLHPVPPGAPPHPRGPRPADGRDGDGAVHARQLVIATGAGPVTLTAAAPAAVIRQPVRAALVPLVVTVAVLALVFALAAWVQLRLALRPIIALRDQVTDIRLGRRARVEDEQPAELQPLASELNALAADNEATLAAARSAAANLAHALKTPVATMRLTLADVPAAQMQLERIDTLIRHHLAGARASAINRRAATPVAAAIADLAAAVRALHPGIALSLDVDESVQVPVDPHDLTEMLGNLLDNAARHARGRVAFTARVEDGEVRLAIADDGPGIPADRRVLAMSPGVRLDEGPVGDGFGLSIVRELVRLYRGSFRLGESEWGGLLAEISFPRR